MPNELNITLPSDREVVLTRVFDAPQRLVFDSLTRPELLKRWWRAPGRMLEVCEVDLRVGGAYRFSWRGPGRKDVGMRGVYREVVPSNRLVRTETWEDWDAGESLDTIELSEQSGRTTLTSTMLFPSREVRDSVLSAGLEDNAALSYDELARCLVPLER